MEAVDFYKLVHQSVYGVGHLLDDAQASNVAIARALKDELSRVPRGPIHENVLDPIDEARGLVRLNLRVYARLAHDLSALAPALRQTAARVEGSPELMRERLKKLVTWLRRNRPALAPATRSLIQEAARAGFPAYHHSARFRRRYHPAYRVVLRSLIPVTLTGRTGRRVFANRLELDRRGARFRWLPGHPRDSPKRRTPTSRDRAGVRRRA